MNWVSIPVAIGREIISIWLVLKDTARLETACNSHVARSNLLQWCNDTTVGDLFIDTEVNSNMMGKILPWLSKMRLFLPWVGVIVSGAVGVGHLHTFLENRGAATAALGMFHEAHLLTSATFSVVCDLFSALPKFCPRLTNLQVSSLIDDSSLAALQGLLGRLTSFRCRDPRLTSAGFTAAAINFRDLKDLHLEDTDIGDDGLLAVAESCTKLESVKCICCPNMTSEGYAAALPKMHALKELTTEVFTQGMAEVITKACHPNLRALEVQSDTSTDDTAIQRLFTNSPPLERLSLMACSSLTDMAFQHTKGLTQLSYRGDLVISTDVAMAIARNNPQLTHLSLSSSTAVDPECVEVVLDRCHTLRHLSLIGGSRQNYRSPMAKVTSMALMKAYPHLKCADVDLY